MERAKFEGRVKKYFDHDFATATFDGPGYEKEFKSLFDIFL